MRRVFAVLVSLCLFCLGGCSEPTPPPESQPESSKEPVSSMEAPGIIESTEPEKTQIEGDCTMEILTFERNGKKIYGELYLPDRKSVV